MIRLALTPVISYILLKAGKKLDGNADIPR